MSGERGVASARRSLNCAERLANRSIISRPCNSISRCWTALRIKIVPAGKPGSPPACSGWEFCAFLRRFSGKREKDQVSIGSGWWQWTQQASARIHSTVRSYFPMSNLERWIGPAQVTGHPSHASPTRTAFRSRVLRRRARGGSAAGALAGRLRRRRASSRGCSPGASGVAGLAAAASPVARVESTREFEPLVAVGAGACVAA